MKWILIVVGVVVALGVLVWIGGSLIPRQHRAASGIALNQPTDSVWVVVRDLGALKGTWKEMTTAVRSTDSQGREVWDETVGGFAMRLIIAEEAPPHRLVANVDSPPGAAFGGRWVYELAPTEGGTAVTVAEEGWIGPPPFRLMSKAMGYHKSIDQYLTALGRHFSESVTPQHLP
ncbi:MAG TPA: SRPBCC family protein [Gemmatimonadales bacterium]